MAHTLPELPYAKNALVPHISEETFEYHYGKHHQAYVTNLNNALANAGDLAKRPLDDLLKNLASVPENIRTAVRNNGGGHANHTLFWNIMGPGKGGAPSGALADAINAKWGSFDDFKAKFKQLGVGRFGSGWAWLVAKADGSIDAYSLPNQDSPLMQGDIPLLGVDVWEHAYYLNYQNRRPDYLDAWWNVVNWDAVAQNYAAARK